MSKSLMLSPNDGGVIDALPISRRNLLARGGALGTASTLGLGFGTILVPAVSHAAYDAPPADATVYSKGTSELHYYTGTYDGKITRFYNWELSTGNFLILINQKNSQGLWAIVSAVTSIRLYHNCYNGVSITRLSDNRIKVVLTKGVGSVAKSDLAGDIDGGRRLADFQWEYPAGATILEAKSLEEHSDANTVAWTKFRVGTSYTLCMAVCHLTQSGDRNWSPVARFPAEFNPTAYRILGGSLATLQTTAKAFTDARGRQKTTLIAATTVAVASVIGIALTAGTGAAVGGVAICAALVAATASAIYASEAAQAYTNAGVLLQTQFETYCSCGHIVR